MPVYVRHGAIYPQNHALCIPESERHQAPVTLPTHHPYPRFILPYAKVIWGWPAFVVSACSKFETPNSDGRAVQPDLPALHLFTVFPVNEHDVVGFEEACVSCYKAHDRLPDGAFLVNPDALDHLADHRFDVAGDRQQTSECHDKVEHVTKGCHLGQ